MSDYQAQTKTECLSTWCTLTAGHGGGHTDLREPRTAREELARIIRDGVGTWRTPLEAADAFLAAGFGRLADAWDEGYTTGNAHNGRRDANPYRSES